MKSLFVLLLLFNSLSNLVFCQDSFNEGKYKGLKLFLTNKDFLQLSFFDLIKFFQKEKFNLVFLPVFEGDLSFYKSDIFKKTDTAFPLIDFRNELRKNYITFAAVCQVFFDASIIEKGKNLLPIDQNGNSHYVNWQKLVCPTDSIYRKNKLDIIKEVLLKLKPDILSLDFIRYPTVWEITDFNTVKDSLRNFCFCERCILKFSEIIHFDLENMSDKKMSIPEIILRDYSSEWAKFKSKNITDFVKDVKEIILSINPKIKLALHLVPWSEDKLDNAIYWLAGQDIISLAEYVDIFSPMVYIEMIGEKPEYIKKLTQELKSKTQKDILPSVQIADILLKNNSVAYQNILNNALTPFSCGVLFFDYFKLLNEYIKYEKY